MADTIEQSNWASRSVGRRFPRSLAGQADHDGEGTINVLQFVARQQTVRFSQAAGVYRANLFDEHASSPAFDLYFGPEGGGKGLSRGRRDDDGGQS